VTSIRCNGDEALAHYLSVKQYFTDDTMR